MSSPSTPSKKMSQAQPPEKPGRPYKVYRQGFLLKPIAKGMRKRLSRYWFVLFEQKDMMAFLYFTDEDHFLERKKNEGFFRIDDATSIDVLPEYMGRKNAFCIATPRNKYVLVSESRYELHEWLFSLHNAMDEFKQHSLQRKKSQVRDRASSTANISSAATNKTPPRIKPSRPAPPIPKDKKKEDEGPVVKDTDVIETEHRHRHHHHHHHHRPPPSPPHLEMPSSTTSPLDAIVAGLLAESDKMQTLEYNMTEEEPLHDDPLDLLPLSEGQNTTSTSMPTLTENGLTKDGSNSPQNNSEQNSDEERGQTRHLSLSESYEEDREERNTLPTDVHSKKKGIRKRSSVKGLRSVSPPNLPPPPPPEKNEETHQQVMNSFTDNDEQITEAAHLKPEPPVRSSSLSPKKTEEGESVQAYIQEAFQHEDSHGFSSPEPPDDEENERNKRVYKETSPGILRRGESSSKVTGKRTVMFQDELEEDRTSPSYEPRIDKEGFVTDDGLPLSVSEAKMKLFGNQETEVARYHKKKLTHNEEPPIQSDDLVQSIESALERTSYMETPPPPNEETLPEKKGFVAIVDNEDSSTSPPARYSSPEVIENHSPQTLDSHQENNQPISWADASPPPIPTTFGNASQNTVYRSLV